MKLVYVFALLISPFDNGLYDFNFPLRFVFLLFYIFLTFFILVLLYDNDRVHHFVWFYFYCYHKNVFIFVGMCAHFLLYISSCLDLDSFNKIEKPKVYCWTLFFLYPIIAMTVLFNSSSPWALSWISVCFFHFGSSEARKFKSKYKSILCWFLVRITDKRKMGGKSPF